MRHRIDIKGVVIPNDEKWIYDWFEIEATCPNDVLEEIQKANGKDLTVIINSGGGSVYDAAEIYTELRDYKGHVETKIVGLAASAANFIALAGDVVKMSPVAEMMVHNASMWNYGDYHSMDKASEILQNTNKVIANAYRLKTGKSYEELLELMDKETWLTPQQALELGLIDKIMFEEDIKLTANVNVTNMIPKEVINKLREEKNLFNKDVSNAIKNTLEPIIQKLEELENKIDGIETVELRTFDGKLVIDSIDLYNHKQEEPRQPIKAKRRGFFF